MFSWTILTDAAMALKPGKRAGCRHLAGRFLAAEAAVMGAEAA